MRMAMLLLVFLVACASNDSKEANAPDRAERDPRPIREISEEKKRDLTAWLAAMEREPVQVVADHLELRVSQEIVNRLTITESRQVHAMQREETPTETIRRYVNKRGSLNHPLEFRLGASRFVILGSAELRFVRQKDAVLQIELRGKVQGKRAGRDFEAARLRFEEGTWHASQ